MRARLDHAILLASPVFSEPVFASLRVFFDAGLWASAANKDYCGNWYFALRQNQASGKFDALVFGRLSIRSTRFAFDSDSSCMFT